MIKDSENRKDSLDKEKDSELWAAVERAERAEAELARLKGQAGQEDAVRETSPPATPRPNAPESSEPDRSENSVPDSPGAEGSEAELRKDSMMAHLLDSLEANKDIGHYGRLVFAMVARHFMPHEEVLSWLTRDPDFSESAATLLLRQVEGRDYNPPKRDRILEWQAQQEFPILPHPDDPDCGNLYRNLTFPDAIYDNIEHYQEQKARVE